VEINECFTLGYLRALVAGIPALDDARNRCLRKWGTETPPITVLFAGVGRAIAENLAVLLGEVQQRLFAGIEESVVSQDSALGTAMATGLVEVLVTSADKNPGLWAEPEKLFGPASLKHAVAWRDFGP
jgi:hypothetical protein